MYLNKKHALLAGFATVALFAYQPVIRAAENSETFKLLSLFGDVFERVRIDYVEETKDVDLIEAAINGMLTSLDPHSGYMNAKAFKEMQIQTRGEFGGLGIEVTMENGLVKVVSPIDDTPASKAGILAGDFITHINDEPVLGLTLSESVEKMRGKVDSQVKLTVLREGQNEPFEPLITRAIIKVKSSRGEAEGDDVAYLRITAFNEQTTDTMREEFKRIKSSLTHLKGVVLDLRNNPGGLLEQAISVSDAFLDQGEIVSTRERDPSRTKRYTANSGDEMVPMNMPLVVLINQGSASASEIVSGALQDHKRAIVLGTKSFGKGSVQTVIPLNEHGAIRLTTARYYTPSGTSIQAKGITPDIEVFPAKIEPIKSEKVRLEADLRHRLKTLEEKKDEVSKADVQEARKDVQEAKEALENSQDKDIPSSKEDFQLQRALDLIRALNVYQDKGKVS